MVKIDCISDLHGHYPKLEGGDLLIVAGDLTARDKPEEYTDFYEWIMSSDYKKRIVIGGNHDNFLQQVEGTFFKVVSSEITYLCDSGTEFEYHDPKFPEEDEGFLPSGKKRLKIWGSPWTLRFKGMNPKCMAFTVDTEEELAEKWAMIPADTDVLVTHCPPYQMLDLVEKISVTENNDHKFKGSPSLRKEVTSRLKPKLHVFGHIHENGGCAIDLMTTIFVNASHVNERYEPVNKPVRIEL